MKNYIKKLKASELAIAIYLTVVLFGLPLVVRNGYFDINVVKYYFYCGTSVLLIPPLLLKLKEGVAVKDFFKSLTLAEKALLVYWVVSALSTLLSPYRFEAFWGNEGRFCGLLLMTIYVIAYFVIARCYKPMSFCMYICIVAGSIVFLLGIADYFNLNLFHFKDNIIDLHLPIFMSTIGNINFYASYGALILGLIATLYTIWPKALGAAIYFILMVISFIGLIIGNSDNAYLTLGVLLAFLPLYLFCNRQGIRRYLMMVSALLLSLMMVKVCDIYLAEVVLAPDGIRAIVARWDSFIYVCLAFWGITAAVYAADYKLHKQEETVSSKIRIGWGIFLLAAAAVLVAVLVDANLLGHAQRYESLRNYVVFNNDWGTHRGFAWRKAVENYMEFPLLQKILGHGPDTFGIISYFHDLEESADLYGEVGS